MNNLDLESTLLKSIVKNEVDLGLYDIQILGFPLWRILRFRMRVKLLNLKISYKHNTKKRKLLKLSLLSESFISLVEIIKVCSTHNRRDNIVFAFPRLQKIDGSYIDKFTDPVIFNSKIKNNCYIFQKPLAGSSFQPRYKSTDSIITTDFIDRFSLILGYIFLPLTGLIYFRRLLALYKKSHEFFHLSPKILITFGAKLGGFISYFYIYYIILRILRPKRVFIVDREIFFPIIRACKILKIPVFEFQHGATHGETPLYSGFYDKRIDPDYFLTFGDIWSGKQFGMPIDSIINIGWAYKKVIDNITRGNDLPSNYILVVSEPPKSKIILETIVSLAKEYSEYVFHIRLHPQESYNSNQLMIVDKYKNISIQNNETDSYLSIYPYKTVIGEKSTVLYEALSLKKKVGRLSYNGLNPSKLTNIDNDGFIYIKSKEKFKEFIDSPNLNKLNYPSAFSKFDKNVIHNLPVGI